MERSDIRDSSSGTADPDIAPLTRRSIRAMPGEKYGSMLIPGVGNGTLNPTAPVTAVWAGVELAESVRAAPTCRLTENGSKLPPISRNAAFPPMEVKPSVARSTTRGASVMRPLNQGFTVC